MAKFSSFCPQVQIYILLTVFSILYHMHNVYTTRSMSFVENNKLNIMISLIMNITVSVIWGVVINTLCNSGKKGLAWILLFFPLFLTILGTTLLLGKKGLDMVGRHI